MVEIEDFIEHFSSGAKGEIVKRQTTYFDAIYSFQNESYSLSKFRIHYRGKREFSLGRGSFLSLHLFGNHPLLLEYIEPIVAVQLVSSVGDKEFFRGKLELAANQVFNGWRSAEKYSFMPLDEFLTESYGILMEAPKTYAEAVLDAAEGSGVKLALCERYKPKGNLPSVLMLDNWYVVADEFRVEAL